LKSWHRIPPVPPSTPRQKIPSRGLVVVVVVVVFFMSAFFLSLSLSRVVFTLHGAKETGTHRTPERLWQSEREHFIVCTLSARTTK